MLKLFDYLLNPVFHHASCWNHLSITSIAQWEIELPESTGNQRQILNSERPRLAETPRNVERQGWRDRALQGCIHGRFLGVSASLGQTQVQALKLAPFTCSNPQAQCVQLDKAFC